MYVHPNIADTVVPKRGKFRVQSFLGNESPVFTIISIAAGLGSAGNVLDPQVSSTIQEQLREGINAPRTLTAEQLKDVTAIGRYLLNLHAGDETWPKNVIWMTHEEIARIQWLIDFIDQRI